MELLKNQSDIEEQLAIEKRRVNYYKTQLKYLKEHFDITKIKPATGELRKYQLDLVDFANQFFKEIKHLNVKPFLMAGSLIGALRHKGFIPWDDDLDFGLIREDYDKLVDYCKKNYKTIIYDIELTDYIKNPYAPGEKWDKAISENPNQYVFFIWSDQIQIGKGNSICDFKFLDFFVLDAFADDYDFNEHRHYLSNLKNEIDKIDYIPSIVNFLDKENFKTLNRKKDGKFLFYGIENMCAYRTKYSKWIPRDYIFPLKKITFESEEFWVPNKTEEYAEYEIPGYMGFPTDVGYSGHLDILKNYIFAKKKKIEFYLVDSFEIYHYLPIYNELIRQGFDAKFIAEPCEINTSGKWFDYETSIKILEELGVNYSTNSYKNADIAITTQYSHLLSRYKNKKGSLSYGFGLNKNSFAHIKECCEGFDFRLIHGEFSKKNSIAFYDEKKLFPIGFPKHDEFFKNKPSRQEVLKELSIKTSKPIIAYFPTYDENSSISDFYDQLKELRKDYFIVTKAHHCTFRLREKRDDLKKLYCFSDLVLEGNYSFSKSSLIGDIVLADAKSGAALEISYLNNDASLIMLSPQKDLTNYFYEDIFNLSLVINSPSQLKEAIIETLQNDTFRKKRIEQLEYMLGAPDSQSTQRAVHVLKQYLMESQLNEK